MSRFAYTYEDPTYDLSIDDDADWEDMSDADLALVKVTMTKEELDLVEQEELQQDL